MSNTTDIDAALADLPDQAQALALCVRDFARDAGIPLTEALKWGQPSFAPPQRAGTPVRVGAEAGRAALYVHCGSPVADMFRDLEPEAEVAGQRCYLPDGPDDPALPVFLGLAFGYKLKR